MFGRQGYPFPLFRTGTAAALGADSALTVLVSPRDRHVPLPEPVGHGLPRRAGVPSRRHVEHPADLDVFNVFNANTALVRVNNITSTTFNALAQNLSPRIARVGLVVGF